MLCRRWNISERFREEREIMVAKTVPTIHTSTEQPMLLAPLISPLDDEVSPKIQKKRTIKARPGRSISVDSEQDMAGSPCTGAGSGSTDTRVTQGHASHT
jgi:hypothetical protein